MLSLAISYGWKINTIDIESAFLEGTQIDRCLTEATKRSWIPQHAHYVAPRAWYLSFKEEPIKTEGMEREYDYTIL